MDVAKEAEKGCVFVAASSRPREGNTSESPSG